MEMRSNKYDTNDKKVERVSRVQKNRHLYDEMNMKIGYDTVDNYENGSKIDLSSLDVNKTNRGDYQIIKEYKNIFTDTNDNSKNIEDEEEQEKNYDINAVLEEAKKNRKNDDELERKRKLNDEEYNVLSNLNKKYLHKKDFTDEDGEELRELIDTITSKTLAEDIKNESDKELLSDLLATTIDIKLEKELSKEELDKIYNPIPQDENENTNTFYTNSMEINKEDLVEKDDEEKEEEDDLFDDISTTSGVKIFIIVFVILVILSVLAFFILKQSGILE